MKQASKKKGFSLIELIVVIAVIAAIAAVIVPQFGNMSGAAKNAADQRNIQLWNEVYSNAYALVGTTVDKTNGALGGMTLVTGFTGLADDTAYTTKGVVPALAVDVLLSDGATHTTFSAPTFAVAGSGTYYFHSGTGINTTK
jgi:prepilin-type N-terminal cleavage/methylation domain-containing protein